MAVAEHETECGVLLSAVPSAARDAHLEAGSGEE